MAIKSEINTAAVAVTGKRKMKKSRIYDSRFLLLLLLPCIIYFVLFHYVPMWGVLIAFKDYKAFLGFTGSQWVGLKHFNLFFNSYDMWQVIRNTFLIGFYMLIWGFPMPLIFALVLNEVKKIQTKKFVQTVSYMPHFLSAVVVVGMVQMVLSPSKGVVNQIIESMGYERVNFLQNPAYFRTIYVASGIWQEMGWGAIIYLAALAGIDPQLYEAAMIDGANKLKQLVHITLPGISPTVVTLLLLRMGKMLSVGFEKVFLLQNPMIYQTSDIISTYVYRQGLANGNFGYGTAVGLFNTIINLIFLVVSNYLARRYSETSLW